MKTEVIISGLQRHILGRLAFISGWPTCFEMAERKEHGTAKWLRVALLVGLAILCFCVIRPFGAAMIWAIIIAFTLSPLQKIFTRWMGGRETWAALSLTFLMILLMVVPLGLLGISMMDDGKALIKEGQQQIVNAPDTPPGWMTGVPIIGGDLGEYWKDFVDSRQDWAWAGASEGEGTESESDSEKGREENTVSNEKKAEEEKSPMDVVGGDHGNLGQLLDKSLRSVSNAAMWLAGIIGGGLSQISIALVLVFFLLKDAPRIAERLKVAAEKIGGGKGLELLDLAGLTVKGVVNGVIGTALVQGIAAGIGFLIVGSPGAILLGVITFFVAVIPIGPPLVWGGVAAWLFIKGDTGWGVFMVIYGVAVISSLDNVVRPLLIGNESRMPFALILFGLIGGTMAFGLIGLFVGPTLLALSYRLINGWTKERSASEEIPTS